MNFIRQGNKRSWTGQSTLISKSYGKKLRQTHQNLSESKQSGEWGISLSMNRILEKLLPSRLLWRLTMVNTIVIIALMTLIGWAVYETACSLTAGMGNLGEQRQEQFNATLLQYVVIFVIIGVVVGGALHLYFTRKIINPIKQLIESTKQIKRGSYPARLSTKAEGELVDLLDQFNEMVEQLERNEYERDKLVTDLSHEIRTPLANLSGYLQALKTGVIAADEQIYATLIKEANRIQDLISQLDQLKQWNSQGAEESCEELFSIQSTVDQVASMFLWQLNKRKIPYHVKIEEANLKGNPSGIEQAINNILANAIDYYKGPGKIVISGKVMKDEYLISISGPGDTISEEDTDRIFDRFYRVDSSRSRETGGSGLGLSITKDIISYHGGEISFLSKDGENIVSFTIPIT